MSLHFSFFMKIWTSTIYGVEPLCVEVEADVSSGLPFFQIVGLPDAVLRESKTRVKSALIQAGFDFPHDSRVVLNLSPSRLPKEGSGLELALAARLLLATGQMQSAPQDALFIGELGLDGSVREVPELAALCLALLKSSTELLVLPRAFTGQLPPSIKGRRIIWISHLDDLRNPLWWENSVLLEPTASLTLQKPDFDHLDFKVSHYWARLFEITAFGEHHTLLVGPPGCGKTFFANKLPVFLGEPRTEHEADLQVLDSVFGRERLPGARPFEAPHHSATMAGLLGTGQGSFPRPGSISKAHGGVLFLDEIFEFQQPVLDALREVLESRKISLSRSGFQMSLPADFLLVAAANPCRCGQWGKLMGRCGCSKRSRQSYQSRASGPLLDRFDIQAWFPSDADLKVDLPIQGREIMRRIKKAKEFKMDLDRSPEWTERARARLQSTGGAVTLRGLGALKRLSETLCFLDMKSSVDSAQVDEAEHLHSNWLSKAEPETWPYQRPFFPTPFGKLAKKDYNQN